MSLIIPKALKNAKLNAGSRNVIKKMRKMNHNDGLTGCRIAGRKAARIEKR
jgi:hypothetical protein